MTTPNPGSETERPRREKSERYFLLSRWLLKHAQEQLERGDTMQASEKAYGAVAHAVKAYGELRGWNHYNHHRVGLILDQLRDEENDPGLTEAFDAVGPCTITILSMSWILPVSGTVWKPPETWWTSWSIFARLPRIKSPLPLSTANSGAG